MSFDKSNPYSLEMHDALQEPYHGKLAGFPKMAIVDRHDPDWLTFNDSQVDVALKDQIDESRIFRKQSIDWLMAGNGGGLAIILSFLAIKSTPPSAVLILLPSMISYLFGLMGAWVAAFYKAKEAQSWIGFYLRHMRYSHALRLYQHNKIDTTKYWNDANAYCDNIISNNIIAKRSIISSALGFSVGSVNFCAYVIISNLN